MYYHEISKECAEAGHDFIHYDSVLEAVAEESGLLDQHGEMRRPFNASEVAEIRHRLGRNQNREK